MFDNYGRCLFNGIIMNMHFDKLTNTLYVDIDTEEVSNSIHLSDSIIIEKGIDTNSLTGFRCLQFEEMDIEKEFSEIQDNFNGLKRRSITPCDITTLRILITMIIKNWFVLKELL